MPLWSHSRQIWPTSSLSCRFSAGRLPRHSSLNDIIKHALSSAGFNAVLEPVGLDRGDGKRPDGMTVFPFSRGKCLIWDCTCVDSFSPSALSLTATEPGSASRSAEDRKNLKYEGLCDRYIFQVIAIETSCVFGRYTNVFISDWVTWPHQFNQFKWIKSFLDNRSQQVVIDGHFSIDAKMTSCVPQGSVLGPLLFLIYINDLPNCVQNSVCRLFADDCILYQRIRSSQDSDKLQADLDQLKNGRAYGSWNLTHPNVRPFP